MSQKQLRSKRTFTSSADEENRDRSKLDETMLSDEDESTLKNRNKVTFF